jgi:hypothetical protein
MIHEHCLCVAKRPDLARDHRQMAIPVAPGLHSLRYFIDRKFSKDYFTMAKCQKFFMPYTLSKNLFINALIFSD